MTQNCCLVRHHLSQKFKTFKKWTNNVCSHYLMGKPTYIDPNAGPALAHVEWKRKKHRNRD